MIKLTDLLKEQGKINNVLLVNYLGQLMSKYKTADEFKKAEPKAFKKAKELGVLKSLFKDEFRRNIKWTPDAIKQAAASYKSRGEFQANNQYAYIKALSLGILDDLFPKKQPPGRKALTPDEIKQAAAPYKSRSEFQINNIRAYIAARKNNMMDDLFPKKFSGGVRPSNIKWTPDTIKQAAAPYKSRSEFFYNNPYVYFKARKAGMMDDLFPKKLTAGRKPKPSTLSEDRNRDLKY
jgi:hypothetical protein